MLPSEGKIIVINYFNIFLQKSDILMHFEFHQISQNEKFLVNLKII